MPPAALDLTGQFLMPDYAALLVCEHVIIDSETFERLTHSRHWSYNKVAETLRAVHSEGYLRLDDYSERLVQARTTIERKVRTALDMIDWSDTLERSAVIWQEFLSTIRASAASLRKRSAQHEIPLAIELDRFLSARLHEGGGVELSDTVWREQMAVRPAFLRTALAANLTYIESNIELSRQLRVPLFDWADYKPFYDTQMRNAQQDALDRTTAEVQQLFSVSFPDFQLRKPSQLVKMLGDRRINALRMLVAAAARGEVIFDREFAVRTLQEVITAERRVARLRSLTSYALLPVSYIPLVGTPLAKIAEEMVGAAFERSTREPLDWFYLISEPQHHGAV